MILLSRVSLHTAGNVESIAFLAKHNCLRTDDAEFIGHSLSITNQHVLHHDLQIRC